LILGKNRYIIVINKGKSGGMEYVKYSGGLMVIASIASVVINGLALKETIKQAKVSDEIREERKKILDNLLSKG